MDVEALLGSQALGTFIGDQNLLDVLQRQEIRITEGFLQKEVMDTSGPDEVQGLKIEFGAGHGTISGCYCRKPIPLAIPFSARFSLHGFLFEPDEKIVRLRIEEIRPLDFDWLTAKVVAGIPFLRYDGRTAVLDLLRIGKLEQLFAREVKGIRIFDHLTIRGLKLRKGELILQIGVRPPA